MPSEQQFAEHRVHKVFTDLAAAVNSLKLKEDSFAGSLTSIKENIKFIGKRLGQIAPRLAVEGDIEAVANYLQGALNEIPAYEASGNNQHIINCLSQCKSAVKQLLQMAILSSKAEKDSALSSILSSFQNKLETLTEETEQKQTEIIEDLENKITEFSNETDSIESRFNELKQLSATFDQGFKTKLAEFQIEFGKSEAERNESIKEEISKIKASYEAEAKVSVELIQSKLEEAQNLVYLLSGSSMAGGYATAAQSEKADADTFRKAAFVYITIAVGALFLILAGELIFGSVKFGLEYVLSRISLVLLFLLPAAYAFSESSKHRKNCDTYARLSFELAAINPYLDAITDFKMANEARVNAAKKYFGGQEEKDTSEESMISLNTFKEAVEPLVKLLKAIKS
jgi:hypothetical protein